MDRARALLDKGYTATEVAQLTGIPRETVRDWGHGRHLRQPRGSDACAHDFSRLDPNAYGYLLGMYLGDGYISARPRDVWLLRVTTDLRYPGIVSECAGAIAGVSKKRAYLVQRRSRCVEVAAYWKHWPCFIPQHGPGRKHTRPIALAPWQRALVFTDPRAFLRGLIHSDGCRIVATERKRAYVRRAPRYAFKNRSEDILRLFCAACDAVGVHYTRSSATQVSVYSKASVTLLDEFIGPKS